MTIWYPDVGRRDGPLYRAIADALAEDVAEGRLASGQRLPTHRDLARRLGVTIGTVTRAYAEAERRGLIDATVGRGTFVKTPTAVASSGADSSSPVVDLRFNRPAFAASTSALAEVLTALAKNPKSGELLRYQEHSGLLRHRAAGAQLIARPGFAVSPERVLVTAGGQHAIAVALLTIARPGDIILTEELTYHGFKRAAQHLGLRLHGVAIDDEGMIPDAFETACRTQTPRALYCTPTLQNPTGAVMSETRRERIAAIAAAYGVAIVEDDIFGFLVPEIRPLAAFAEGPVCYISSVSKSLAPGLRVGFLAVSEGESLRYADAIHVTSWMAPPLSAEIVCRWVEDGTAERLIAAQRDENAARVRLAAERLGPLMPRAHPAAPHLWLKLPPPWRADRFQQEAFAAGVAVAGAEAFAVTAPAPDAVRICLGAVSNRDLLDKALSTLARLAHSADQGMGFPPSIL